MERNTEFNTQFKATEDLRFQQDIGDFFAWYLPQKHPDVATWLKELVPTLDINDPQKVGEAMALRSCLPVAMLDYLQMGGRLQGVELEEYFDNIWPAFDFGNTWMWLRGVMTRIMYEKYGVHLLSYNMKYVDAPLTADSFERTVQAGYMLPQDRDVYANQFHAHDIASVLRQSPALITIKNPVGAGLAHAVIGWDTNNGSFRYFNPDKRDAPGDDGFVTAPLDMLDSPVVHHGAVSVLLGQ